MGVAVNEQSESKVTLAVTKPLTTVVNAYFSVFRGILDHLGERLNGIQGVRDSLPISNTIENSRLT